MEIHLNEKSAVVTGAGSGIGKEIAHTLAAHGAAVTVGDVNGEAGQKTADEIIEHGAPSIIRKNLKLDPDGLFSTILSFYQNTQKKMAYSGNGAKPKKWYKTEKMVQNLKNSTKPKKWYKT